MEKKNENEIENENENEIKSEQNNTDQILSDINEDQENNLENDLNNNDTLDTDDNNTSLLEDNKNKNKSKIIIILVIILIIILGAGSYKYLNKDNLNGNNTIAAIENLQETNGVGELRMKFTEYKINDKDLNIDYLTNFKIKDNNNIIENKTVDGIEEKVYLKEGEFFVTNDDKTQHIDKDNNKLKYLEVKNELSLIESLNELFNIDFNKLPIDKLKLTDSSYENFEGKEIKARLLPYEYKIDDDLMSGNVSINTYLNKNKDEIDYIKMYFDLNIKIGEKTTNISLGVDFDLTEMDGNIQLNFPKNIEESEEYSFNLN